MPSAAPVIARNFRAKGRNPGSEATLVGHHQARGAHVVAIQWNGLGLLIDHSTLRRQSMRAGSHHTPINTCPFQRNSTRQHYDTIEIIAPAAENCTCMFVIVKDPAKRPRVPPRISQRPDLRKSCSPPCGEQGCESLVRISH